MPPGAEAFRAGEVYSHGGLSPQECVMPDISVGGSGTTAGIAGAKIVARSAGGVCARPSIWPANSRSYSVEVRRPQGRREPPPVERGDDRRFAGEARPMSDEIDEGEKVLVVLLDRHGSVIDAKVPAVGERG